MDAFWIVILVFMCFFVLPGSIMLVSMAFDKMEEEIKRRKEAKDDKDIA